MASRYPLCWPASASSRSPSLRVRVDQRPAAAATFFPAEEAIVEPTDDLFEGFSAVEFDVHFPGHSKHTL